MTHLLGITETRFDRLWLLITITNLSSLLPLPLLGWLPDEKAAPKSELPRRWWPIRWCWGGGAGVAFRGGGGGVLKDLLDFGDFWDKFLEAPFDAHTQGHGGTGAGTTGSL